MGKVPEGYLAKVLLLEKQGAGLWETLKFDKYFKKVLGKGQSSNMSIVSSCYSDTQIVGTKVFDNMWGGRKGMHGRQIEYPHVKQEKETICSKKLPAPDN